MAEPVSFVRASQDFFSKSPHGRKLEIAEFKALTRQDREDLHEMLIGEGFNVLPLPQPDNTSE
jgi:hypothetical protein